MHTIYAAKPPHSYNSITMLIKLNHTFRALQNQLSEIFEGCTHSTYRWPSNNWSTKLALGLKHTFALTCVLFLHVWVISCVYMYILNAVFILSLLAFWSLSNCQNSCFLPVYSMNVLKFEFIKIFAIRYLQNNLILACNRLIPNKLATKCLVSVWSRWAQTIIMCPL